MVNPDPKIAEKKAAEIHPGHDASCRCKETSRMTPAELLKLMMNDLAFWKKENTKKKQ